jgi:hypothetical protein
LRRTNWFDLALVVLGNCFKYDENSANNDLARRSNMQPGELIAYEGDWPRLIGKTREFLNGLARRLS